MHGAKNQQVEANIKFIHKASKNLILINYCKITTSKQSQLKIELTIIVASNIISIK